MLFSAVKKSWYLRSAVTNISAPEAFAALIAKLPEPPKTAIFLMGLSRKQQNKIYKRYWEIIENLAKDESSNKNKVYLEFKNKYSTKKFDEIEIALIELTKLVKHYNKLLNPDNEVDKDIRLHLKYINKLEINVSYPFLLFFAITPNDTAKMSAVFNASHFQTETKVN